MTIERASSDEARVDTQTRRKRIRFVTTAAILMGAYYGVILTPFGDWCLARALEGSAALSAQVLRALGFATEAIGTKIQSRDFSIRVQRGCDGLESAWMLAAAILAFPAPFRRKWAPILLGAAALQALNITRIASLFMIGLAQPDWFDLAHVQLWPAAMVVCALGIWIAWARREGTQAP